MRAHSAAASASEERRVLVEPHTHPDAADARGNANRNPDAVDAGAYDRYADPNSNGNGNSNSNNNSYTYRDTSKW